MQRRKIDFEGKETVILGFKMSLACSTASCMQKERPKNIDTSALQLEVIYVPYMTPLPASRRSQYNLSIKKTNKIYIDERRETRCLRPTC